MQKHRAVFFQLNLFLAFIEGLFVFWKYLQEPSEVQSVLLWGYSALRLALLFSIGLLILVLFLSLVRAKTGTFWVRKVENIFDTAIDRTFTFWILFLLLGLVYLALFLSDHQLGGLASYRDTLRPLFGWFGLVSLQLFFSYILVRGYEFAVLREYRGVLIETLVALALLGVLTGFIAITKLGLTPDTIYWQDAGAPIQFFQVLLASIMGMVFCFLRQRDKSSITKKADFFIVFSLWALACILWMSFPLKPAYNSIAPGPPNYQSYPFGDALRYDLTAQEFMIGQPIPADFFVKPLYSFLLVLFHLIGGQDYSRIIFIQVALLACVPSLIYLLTRELSTPLAAIIAALLIIFREKNAISLSNVIQVSHSRLLLSDVPTMGLMILMAWLMVKWSKQQSGRKWIPLAVGGVLGFLILTRGNPILLIPFVLLAGFLVMQRQKTFWREFFLPFSFGLLLVLIPWFLHNYQITGKLTFQDLSSPNLVQDQLVQIYSETPVGGNIDGQNLANTHSQVGFIRNMIIDPLATLQLMSAHFFHNIVHSYIVLPQSFLIESVARYTKRLPFWSGWHGNLPSESWLILLLNFSILALGFVSGWRKSRYAILIPLLLAIGYNLSVALTRRSGWRFNLPVDWITIVFYAIGLAQLIMIVRSMVMDKYYSLRDAQDLDHKPPSRIASQVQFWSLALLFAFISLGTSQGYRLFLNRLSMVGEGELMIKLQNTLPDFPQGFIEEDKAVVIRGRGMYPVYLRAGEGILNYSYLNFSAKPYDRLVFYVVGNRTVGVVLKTDFSPQVFPDGADVVVVGCDNDDGYINASAVFVESDPSKVYLREPFPGWHCPVLAP